MWRFIIVVFRGVLLITFVRIILAKCGGKTAIYDSLNGTVALGSDEYSPNTHCEWLIKAPRPGQRILLTFREFDTECAFDYLKVYDGSSHQNLLGAFSIGTMPPTLISNTSSVVLEFFSDDNYTRKGAVIDYLITDCPGNCSGHGACVANKCNCNELYTGEACDVENCPQSCNNVSGNGQCLKSSVCQCNEDYMGQSCSFSFRDDTDTGSWHLIRDRSPVFRSRFGHAGVYVEDDNAFWIFGGSNLNVMFDDLVKYSFDANNWLLIHPTGHRPVARTRHSLVKYKDTLVVFGGELANGTLVNDLWMFTLSTSTWKQLRGNNSPHGLASHCASIADDQLVIFGGKTQEHTLSHHMYMYNLKEQNGWERITYKLAKISDLRLVGHTCVFYPTLRSLVVFGGYRTDTGKASSKRSKVLLYNVDGKVWMSVDASAEPKPRAYHSSVIIGDYMVAYGGVIHTHYVGETCYEDDIFLLNLKNFIWSSILSTSSASNISYRRGRYSHVVAAVNQNILLVAGGFSGIANGDLLAYKIPPRMIASVPINMCPMFSQCVLCLTWGSHLRCGWGVQDSTCYPLGFPSPVCSPGKITRGWWGDTGTFLTTVDQCRMQDNSPGLNSNVSFKTNINDIHIVNRLWKNIDDPQQLLSIKWSGFLYPFISQSTRDPVSLQLYAGGLSVSLRLGIDERKETAEKVISFKPETGRVHGSSYASRPTGLALFPNATINKKYYIEVNAEYEEKATIAHLEVRFRSPNVKLIDGQYIRPYFSNNCEQYITCAKCLFDASCGWCPTTSTCVKRNSSVRCQQSSGADIYFVLDYSYCETCAQHVDCESCSKDDLCIWRDQQKVQGRIVRCEPLGALQSKDQASKCSPSCRSYSDCNSCIKNTNCLWCEKQHKCIPWVSHPAVFMHGECSQWSDILTGAGKCSFCSGLSACAECLRTRHCGWCGEFHNGSCHAGGYDAPYSGSCAQFIGEEANSYSSNWSYTECPDENECITRRVCDKNADCFNTLGSYRCECRDGYKGNGTVCKALCNPPCVHGSCNKHPTNESLDSCACDLGWTGNVCSINCECNNHSTCITGIGVCDDCQELTHGKKCELCVTGSYGDATSTGCKKCECNGHGDEQRGICDGRNGLCFCMNNTMGPQCGQCIPGFAGYPQRGEGCYYPCRAHTILANISQGTLSNLPEPGKNYDASNVNCVWIITTLLTDSEQVLYTNKLAPGTVTFWMKDIALDCQTDHVYVYDGMPNFKVGVKSSFNLIASLCGMDASRVPAMESRSGTLVVVFKGNFGQSLATSGFNASFVVNQCPNSCTGNRYCRNNDTHENCICKTGWTGAACDNVICPAYCSESLSQGHCDKNSGKCMCERGFTGVSCNVQHMFDDFVWEDVTGSSSSVLSRMGHTMVADNQTESLIIYGGYSLYLGILGDVWKYDTKTKKYDRDYDWRTKPSPRYFHAADVYQRTLYVTGGITEQSYSSEVWKYDLDTKQWQEAEMLPREMAGHTVNVIGDTIYLIGGYSPNKSCSSNVYTLKLGITSSSWSDLKQSGDKFDACFGHTTVYDPVMNSLVVFGKKATEVKPTLAVLELTTNKWEVMAVSQEFLRYFHVSTIVGDIMLVTTGYTGNNIQDFTREPLVYDLRCKSWHKPNLKGTFPSFLAHSAAASLNKATYVFGGYNGLSSNKLFRQNISSNWCSIFTSEVSCSSVRNCVWCMDTARNLSTCHLSGTHSYLNCTAVDDSCGNDLLATRSLRSPVTSWKDVCVENSVPGGCPSCIAAQDGGTSSICSWSTDSHLCFSFFFQPITCAFGICGRVLRHYDVCPAACHSSSYCHDCLEQYNCGWCTGEAHNGRGVCTQGTLLGPYDGTCKNYTIWSSSVCFPENECENGHHQCNENETCFDLELMYKCDCKPGYERRNGSCVPVCTAGCVQGSCIAPDNCLCHFGWVGTNCSIECHCHKKGQCVDENHLDQCRDCIDHTTGTSCHRCLPRYVGKDSQCQSCVDVCNGNADICYDNNEKNSTKSSLYGPIDSEHVVCECTGNSKGTKCDECNDGFYILNNECVKCNCRGHADRPCNEKGVDCVCQNKTGTPKYADSNNQCSMCIENYLGSPSIEGQQCYRVLRILSRTPLTRGDYEYIPAYLTSFYYVHPSYSNANIRLTIDVSDGALDVYISFADNVFKVNPSQNISITLTPVTSPDVYSDGLNTYATFSGETKVMLFKAITHRLVVTFPYHEHHLDKKKFYLVLKAGNSVAAGIIYFKQDTTKMNLIVFFIVFASCFVFLLSGICVVWSIKNHLRSRQVVHNLQVENERLHNRPFAKYDFLFEHQLPSSSVIRHRKTTASTRRAVRAMGVQCTSDYHSSVTTVMFQMPQTEKTKMAVSLGTTLTLMNPQLLDRLQQTPSKLTQEMTEL